MTNSREMKYGDSILNLEQITYKVQSSNTQHTALYHHYCSLDLEYILYVKLTLSQSRHLRDQHITQTHVVLELPPHEKFIFKTIR